MQIYTLDKTTVESINRLREHELNLNYKGAPVIRSDMAVFKLLILYFNKEIEREMAVRLAEMFRKQEIAVVQDMDGISVAHYLAERDALPFKLWNKDILDMEDKGETSVKDVLIFKGRYPKDAETAINWLETYTDNDRLVAAYFALADAAGLETANDIKDALDIQCETFIRKYPTPKAFFEQNENRDHYLVRLEIDAVPVRALKQVKDAGGISLLQHLFEQNLISDKYIRARNALTIFDAETAMDMIVDAEYEFERRCGKLWLLDNADRVDIQMVFDRLLTSLSPADFVNLVLGIFDEQANAPLNKAKSNDEYFKDICERMFKNLDDEETDQLLNMLSEIEEQEKQEEKAAEDEDEPFLF